MKGLVTRLQPIGRALMLPIAVLPVAALLLRLGQPDLLNIAAVAAAGNAIINNMGLLFAIGIAVGLARENHGAAGLASVVCYLVATEGAKVLIGVPPDTTAGLSGKAVDLAIAAFRNDQIARFSIPAGLASGLISGWLYNRYSEIRLPDYLAFFGGRRFVPIISGCAGVVLALALGWGSAGLEQGMDAVSRAVLDAGSFGLFIYGVLNRILIVTGLHHILNNFAWFLLGDYNGVTGDLRRFFAGDPSAGVFMSGFFPVMMFGLPAACLAMYHTALPDRRKAVGGLLLSMALTSFLTGVTEPVEFSFMFLAPFLFAVHAVLTGVSMVLMDWLGVRLGFGFSAGLFDYVLNFSKATRPLWLIPVGLVYFGLYYGLFRVCIVRFNLGTPGREDEAEASAAVEKGDSGIRAWVLALGGAANLVTVDACTTRLRLVVVNQEIVDDPQTKRLGARGLVRPSADTLQVVVGPIADQLASDIRRELKLMTAEGQPAMSSELKSLSSAAKLVGAGATTWPPTPLASSGLHADVSASTVLRALGGARNIREVRLAASRLCVTLEDAAAASVRALADLTVRGVARPGERTVHIVVGPAAPIVFQQLNDLLMATDSGTPVGNEPA